MKDPELELSRAYYTLLNNLTVGAIEVPFYSVRPRAAQRPFMLLTNPTLGDQDSDKSKFNNLVFFTIDIQDEVEVGTNNPGSRLREKQIAEKIVEVITTAEFNPITPGFNVITSILTNKETIPPETTGGGLIFRTLLTFEHWIESL